MGVGAKYQQLTDTGNWLAVVITELKAPLILSILKYPKMFSCPCITQFLVDLSESQEK